MKLTATTIRNAKPADKPYKLFDGGGLFLLVRPDGSKYWRLKYRYGGKEKLLALGVYPEVPLADARDRRAQARTLLREGIDPLAKRKEEKRAARIAAATSFEAVAREWLDKQAPKLAPITLKRAEDILEKMAFPWLGGQPVSEITPPELLDVLRKVESQGKLETAQRLKQRCSQVFRYAIATGRAERDPTTDLRGALVTPKTQHRAAVTDPAQVGELLRAIDGFSGQFVTHCALRFLPLVFVRPGELRFAEWREFDLDQGIWRIPAKRTKMREAHLVPLSTQAVAILRELEPLTGRGKYVFPGIRTNRRPMSENTVNAALRRLGYAKDEMTGHGFRSMATTLLNEQGWPPDVIERQLAHAERNKVRAAYNRAEHLAERKRMMQAWADYLDGLRSGAQGGADQAGSMSEQGNTKETALLASWPVCGIHPSKWIELDREDLNKAAGITFSDEHYGQLMDALHNYQLAQQVRLPPLDKIEGRLDRLANKPDQASRILAKSKPNNVEFFDPSDRNYRRCRDYVNYHVWHLLAAQGAYVPIGCDEPFSLSLDQIEAARKSARFLAQADRPKGSSTKGRPIQPGLLELIDEIIRVWWAAGGRGAIWYLDRTKDKWCGFLYGTLMLLLKAADYIMHLEVFHGGNPSSVSDDERRVGKAELDDYISNVLTTSNMYSQIGEKTVYRYYLRTQHSSTAD